MLPALSPFANDFPLAPSSPHARFNLFMLFSLLSADALPEVDPIDHKFLIFDQKKTREEENVPSAFGDAQRQPLTWDRMWSWQLF